VDHAAALAEFESALAETIRFNTSTVMTTEGVRRGGRARERGRRAELGISQSGDRER
jgi:hypothetical protein